MEYHTQKEPLTLAEYGRYVQDMVNHTLTIADRDERNKAAQSVIQVMTQLNPGYKDNDELQHKLWDDLHVIANYKLDVDSPYPMPERKETIVPERVAYPDQKFTYKHYGKIIEGLIAEARKMENMEERKALTGMIANLMKKSYLNYNRDSVNDEMLADQLNKMSNGELTLDDDFRFHHTNDILSKNRKTNTNQRSNNNNKGRNQKRKWKK